MGLAQQGRGEPGRQLTGVPHFDAISKDNNLDKSVVAVIPVGNRIDDGLSDDRAGNLELKGACVLVARVPTLRSILPRTNSTA